MTDSEVTPTPVRAEAVKYMLLRLSMADSIKNAQSHSKDYVQTCSVWGV